MDRFTKCPVIVHVQGDEREYLKTFLLSNTDLLGCKVSSGAGVCLKVLLSLSVVTLYVLQKQVPALQQIFTCLFLLRLVGSVANRQNHIHYDF